MSVTPQIFRLTDDVLGVIFSKLCEDIHLATDKNWDWTQVTHVCQKWRVCALETPSLWANIFSSRFSSPARTRAFLERSRNASLSLTLNYLSFDNIRMCLEHIDRIRSVDITGKFGPYRWSSVPVFLSKRAPRLTSVTINNISYDEFTANLEPWFSEDDENGSSLTSIRLIGFSLTWTSPALRNLTTLSLQKIVDSTKFPKVSELVSILINSPGLQIFQLLGVGVINDDFIPITALRLPRLKIFNINGVNYGIVAKLTHAICIPDDVQYKVSCLDYPFQSPDVLFPSFLAYDHISDALTIEFHHYNTTITLHGEHRKEKIALDLYQHHESDDIVMFKAITTTVGDNLWIFIKKLFISPGMDELRGLTTEHWISFLKYFPNLEVLHFGNTGYSMKSGTEPGETLIRALSQIEISSCLGISVLCSKLTNLVIHCLDFGGIDGNIFKEMKFCLEMRVQRGIKLRRLDIWNAVGTDYVHLSELSELVDECGLFTGGNFGLSGNGIRITKGPQRSFVEQILQQADMGVD